MAEPTPADDGRAVWRTAFSVVFAFSVYALFSPDSQIPTGIDVNDKVVHAAIFAALAITGPLAGLPVRPLLIGLVVYAGLSEVLQPILPINRDGDPFDALADVGGALLGVAVVLVARRSARSQGVGGG